MTVKRWLDAAVFLALALGTYRAELSSLVGSLRREHQWSDRLIAFAPSGLLVVRPTGQVLQANQAVGEILRRDAPGLVGLRSDSFDDDPASGLTPILHQAIEAEAALIEGEWTARTPEGMRLTLAYGARAVPGPDGEIVVLVNVVDVSERRIEERHAHDAAHDKLTGLPTAASWRPSSFAIRASTPVSAVPCC
ncbi:PAS domain-containing protein [Phycicoccus jejuensis]|uniref:hypothetical protein n=1 Tax=Phycicoccus jejuensis TaxID=367299 RepID=UPI0038502C8C